MTPLEKRGASTVRFASCRFSVRVGQSSWAHADPRPDVLLGEPDRHASATIVYVNAGTSWHRQSISGILSRRWWARSFCSRISARRQVRRRVRQSAPPAGEMAEAREIRAQPRRDRRGFAGLVAAYIAAAVKAKVTLIEKDRMGGDCLYTGCVPSKALIKSARLVAQAKRAREFGFKAMQVEFDFADVMEWVNAW